MQRAYSIVFMRAGHAFAKIGELHIYEIESPKYLDHTEMRQDKRLAMSLNMLLNLRIIKGDILLKLFSHRDYGWRNHKSVPTGFSVIS